MYSGVKKIWEAFQSKHVSFFSRLGNQPRKVKMENQPQKLEWINYCVWINDYIDSRGWISRGKQIKLHLLWTLNVFGWKIPRKIWKYVFCGFKSGLPTVQPGLFIAAEAAAPPPSPPPPSSSHRCPSSFSRPDQSHTVLTVRLPAAVRSPQLWRPRHLLHPLFLRFSLGVVCPLLLSMEMGAVVSGGLANGGGGC